MLNNLTWENYLHSYITVKKKNKKRERKKKGGLYVLIFFSYERGDVTSG